MPNFNPQFEKIGDILIHDGCIDESQLSEALEDQKIKKGKRKRKRKRKRKTRKYKR